VVYALAWRAGGVWLVVIVDAALSTFGKRTAALSLEIGSLRPKGYERERFADALLGCLQHQSDDDAAARGVG
jgi:hypothetical protein